MKIQHIAIENFIGIRHLDADLETPVVVIAGENGAGKSSVRDALRFCLLGDPGRVTRKKDFATLLPPGAKDGSVGVTLDGAKYVRTVKSGNPATSSPPNIAELPYVLDADCFAALDTKSRRRFLMDLMGVAASRDDIAKELTERGHKQARIDEVLPLLRSGFDAAADYAAKQATQAKGAWRGVTGETYGAKKAEDWAVEIPGNAARPEDFARMERAIRDLERENASAQQRIGTLRAQIQHADQASAEIEERRTLAAQQQDAEHAFEVAERARDEAEHACDKLSAELDAACTEAPKYECPACEVLLVERDGELVKYNPGKAGKGVDESQVAALDERKKDAVARVIEAREAYREAEHHLTRCRNATELLKAAPAEEFADPDTTEKEIKNLEDACAERESLLRDSRDELTDMEAERRLIAEATQKTDQAAAHHADVQAWSALADALGPEGIPAQLLKRTLAPLNDRLLSSANVTGWSVVELSADMEITYGERPYGLASESERWRADAMIAEAIAWLSGLKLLVLDRLDVLSPRNRVPALKWLAGLSETYDTIIVAATLKQPPGRLPDGVSCWWLERGRIVELEEAA